MKGILTSLVSLFLWHAGYSQSQWTTSGNSANNINNTNSGSVGIGTTAPVYTLDVNGSIRVTTGNFIHFTRAGTNRNISLTSTSNNDDLGMLSAYPSTGSNVASIFAIIPKGLGAHGFKAQLSLYNNDYTTDAVNAERLQIGAYGSKFAIFSGPWGTGAHRPIDIYANGTSGQLFLSTNGSVGVGTTSPSSKLDVAGEIRSSTGGFRFPDGTLQATAATGGGGGGGGTITGVSPGTGLTGGGTTGSVTLTNSDRGSSQSIFKNIADGTGTTRFSAGSNNDSFRFAGTGGTAVTFDAATKKITIDATASTGAAANIAAGQFGQNTGGGNYTFPGNVTVNGTINAKYQDVAEWVSTSQRLSTGTVVILDVERPNQVVSSTTAYDTRVAGVLSDQPGLALGEGGEGRVLVATTGRVRVRVDARKNPICIGDLLVTSDTPGLAMKSEPVKVGKRSMHQPGTLIGKALEPLDKGQGEILVLLSLQ